MKEITKKMVVNYLAKDGAKCLFCGDTNLERSYVNNDLDNGNTWEQVVCMDCHERWIDSYTPTAVIYNGVIYDVRNDEQLNGLFRHFASHNFVDVGDMMGELAQFIGIKKTVEVEILKAEAERKRLNEVTILEGLWKELRTTDHASASHVMGHLAQIIQAKRGDSKPLCGCGGTCSYYDGALGYDAMVCTSCGQHFTSV